DGIFSYILGGALFPRAGRWHSYGVPACSAHPASGDVFFFSTLQSLGARRERNPTRRHLENVRAAGNVENVRSFEEARKRLAVLAVTDEAKARPVSIFHWLPAQESTVGRSFRHRPHIWAACEGSRGLAIG